MGMFQNGAFICWLCCLGKLSTEDRFRSWCMEIELIVFFVLNKKNLSNIYFLDVPSLEVWGTILTNCMNWRQPGLWDDDMELAVLR